MAAERVAEAVSRVINSNTFINICLVGCFSVLGLRSMNQQDLIEAMESDNSRLTAANKSLKKTMWDWKQKLYAEASDSSSAVVPLSRLKSIYGDVVSPPPPPPPPSSDGVALETGQPSANIVV